MGCPYSQNKTSRMYWNLFSLDIIILKNTSNYDEKIYVRFGSSIPLSFCSSLIFEDKTFSGSGRVSINGSFNVTDLFSNP